MATIKIEGFDELEKALKDNVTLQSVKTVIKKNGSELQDKIQKNADFKGHMGYKDGVYQFIPPTGATHDSVRLDIKDNGLTAESGATTEYAPYLEYGTRFMDAQSFVKPALDEQVKKFRKNLEKLMK